MVSMIPDKKFELVDEPRRGWWGCEVCCMTVKGLAHYCEAESLVVHEKCANLRKVIQFEDDHGEREELYPVEGKAKSKCIKCKKISPEGKRGDIHGFNYQSERGDISLHVSCFNNGTRKDPEASKKKDKKKKKKKKKKSWWGNKVADEVVDTLSTTCLTILTGGSVPVVTLANNLF